MYRTRAPVLLFLTLFALTACTTGPAPPPTPLQRQALINLSVALGTSLFLRQHPTLAPITWRLAHDAAMTTTGPLDVTQLAPTLGALIDQTAWSLPEKGLMRELVATILLEVQAYVTRAHLQPTQVQLVASEILGAIERAALAQLGGVAPVAGGA